MVRSIRFRFSDRLVSFSRLLPRTALMACLGLEVLGGAAVGALALPQAAFAQSDTAVLVDRIDRLERDLSILQRNVARNGGGSGGGNMVLTSPAAGGGAGAESSGGDTLASLQLRLSQLESRLQDVTGQIEQANYKAQQAGQKVDRMAADNDLRFREIEQKVGLAPAGGANNGAASGAGPATNANSAPPLPPGLPASLNPQSLPTPAQQAPQGGAQAPSPNNSSSNSSLGAPPQMLGQISGNDMKKFQATPTPPTAAPTAATTTKPTNPKELYDGALALHNDGDDDAAERAFNNFLQAYPKDALASSAQYWLAETYYARKDYNQAVVKFAESYEKYPKGNKAPDSLVRLGESFFGAGKKREACIAVARLNSEFPSPGDAIKKRSQALAKHAECK